MKSIPSPTGEKGTNNDVKKCERVINDDAKKKKRRRRRGKTVRTLYISRLPVDVKPREIYLMFRSFTGYQSSMLLSGKEGNKPTPVAFVTFENRDQAKVAEKALHGQQFDPEQPIYMNIEFAKENTKNERISHITRPQSTTSNNTSPPIQTPSNLQLGAFHVTINGPTCAQGNANVKDMNCNNMPFPPPFFYGMPPLPINYPGVMMPPPNPYIPYQNNALIPTAIAMPVTENNIVQSTTS